MNLAWTGGWHDPTDTATIKFLAENPVPTGRVHGDPDSAKVLSSSEQRVAARLAQLEHLDDLTEMDPA